MKGLDASFPSLSKVSIHGKCKKNHKELSRKTLQECDKAQKFCPILGVGGEGGGHCSVASNSKVAERPTNSRAQQGY